MEDPRPPIRADSLRVREEWRNAFSGAGILREGTADEGKEIGFDGLDPSAMVRVMYRTRAPGADVLQWYRDSLEPLGWVRRQPRRDGWWEWRLLLVPGESNTFDA